MATETVLGFAESALRGSSIPSPVRRQRAPAPPLAPHPGRPQKQHPPRQQAEGFRDHASPAVAAYSAGCGLPAIFGHRVQRPRCRLTWEQRAPDSSHLASLGPPAADPVTSSLLPTSRKSSTPPEPTGQDGNVATDIENTDNAKNNDWLHSNKSYQPVRIGYFQHI
ncbi:hypothetical protein SORBI_3001G261569 [Sorghum bicolor]|uniref:Uncharacterized protein n=1 Tax=Sorghum bicolor TaxID=4558 RepID=A0A1Z5S7L5_SORBI|nr:hypothetical protein SORBI_3001G261569 [Sorghum bicolor]